MGNIVPDFTADTTTRPISFHEWIGDDRMQVGLTMAFNDSDADGTVSMEEFVSNSAAWLAQIDRNGDGMITCADFGPQSN